MTSVVVRPRTSAPVNSKMMARTTACHSFRVFAPTDVAKALATSFAPGVEREGGSEGGSGEIRRERAREGLHE